MADGAVIREFLVSLGYKVDKGSERQFERGLEAATEGAKRLGEAVAATAAAVAAGVTAMASKLEGLYYASRRTGASVESIRAFGYAVSQMGGTAEEAMGSLEGLARAMRNNPGIRGLVAGLVAPGTNLNDAAETITALGDAFRRMPRHIAQQYAGILGIDERTLQATIDGVRQFEEQYRQRTRRMGVDNQQAAESSREFMRAMRDLQSVGEIALTKLTIALAPVAPQIADMAERFVLWVERVTPEVNDFVERTIGWGNALTALGVLLSIRLLSPLRGIVAALGALALFTPPAWLLALLGVAIPGGSNNEREDLERWRRGEALPGQENMRPDGTPQPQPEGWWQRNMPRWLGGNVPSSVEQRQLGAQAMDFFQRMGWTAEQAAGLAAQIQKESSFRLDAVGDGGKAFGLLQWHPDRQAAFRRWAGKDIREATFEDQLAFMHYELTQGAERAAGNLLRQATSAGGAGLVLSQRYVRPHDPDGSKALERREAAEGWFSLAQQNAARLARPPVPITVVPSGGGATVNQTTNITVNGASDPGGTAREVGREQGRVNSDLVRNLQGAMW